VVTVVTGLKRTEMKEVTVALHETVDISGWKTIGSYLAGEDLKYLTLVAEPGEEIPDKDAPTLF
jgi:hypothetical protein